MKPCPPNFIFPVENYVIKIFPHDEKFPPIFKQNGLSPLFLDNFRETIIQNIIFLLIYFIFKFFLPKISRQAKKKLRTKYKNKFIIKYFLKAIIKVCMFM